MNTTTKKIIGVVAIAAIVWGGFAYYKDSKGGSSEAIKVGLVLPLTGEASVYGEYGKRGAELAAEKANKENVTKIQLVFEDDQMDPKKSVSVMQKLIAVDHVKNIVSMASGQSLAICPIAEENKMVFLTVGTAPAITNCGDYTFRDTPSDTFQAKEMAKKFHDKGFKKVAVLYVNNDYGKGLAEEFKKDFQGEIVAYEAHDVKETSYRTQLSKIKAANPEVIVAFTYIPEGYSILKQKYELNIKQPMYGSEAFKDASVIEKVSAKALENFFAMSIAPYNGAAAQEFKAAHMAKYGQEPGVYADFVYDNVLAIGKAVQACKDLSDSQCVKDAMYKTDFDGATGKIRFDQNGDIKDKAYQLYKVENGKFVETQ